MSRINKTEFIRVEKNKNYTVIHNQFLKRKDLSWKAKGILAYVLSLPDDWNINIDEVMKHATEGKSAFRSGWKELREAGYVKRKPVKDPVSKKIIYWETIVYENVDLTAKEPHTDYPPSGKPSDGKPESGKSNTTKYLKELSTNEPNTDKDSCNSGKPKYADDSPYMKLANRLFEHIQKRNPNQKEPNWQIWADDFRKTAELDKKELAEMWDVLNWCQQDDFWQNNILSPAKFRMQYDQLFLKMSERTKVGGMSYGGIEF